MTKILARPLAPLSAILLFFGLFSCAGQPPKSGLVDGHLRPCPNSPNCLNSETPGPAHIPPLPYGSPVAQAWQNLRQTVEETGGMIVDSSPGYLRAVYTSQLMRYEDDVEFRLNEPESRFEMRSASRTGYWDLGANRRRLEQIRRLFAGREERSGR